MACVIGDACLVSRSSCVRLPQPSCSTVPAGICAGCVGSVGHGSLPRCGASCPGWGVTRPCLHIVNAVFDAQVDPVGVTAHRAGALERAHLVLQDGQHTRRGLNEVEARMVDVLDQLELTMLVTSIHGLTAVGAATLLAETGDLTRFASPRAVVKHAGLCPRDNTSGAHQGKTSLSGRGRPELRLAAWLAVWAALPNNPVLAARFGHLTTRQNNPLARQQAAPRAPPRYCAGWTWSSGQ